MNYSITSEKSTRWTRTQYQYFIFKYHVSLCNNILKCIVLWDFILISINCTWQHGESITNLIKNRIINITENSSKCVCFFLFFFYHIMMLDLKSSTHFILHIKPSSGSRPDLAEQIASLYSTDVCCTWYKSDSHSWYFSDEDDCLTLIKPFSTLCALWIGGVIIQEVHSYQYRTASSEDKSVHSEHLCIELQWRFPWSGRVGPKQHLQNDHSFVSVFPSSDYKIPFLQVNAFAIKRKHPLYCLLTLVRIINVKIHRHISCEMFLLPIRHTQPALESSSHADLSFSSWINNEAPKNKLIPANLLLLVHRHKIVWL